MNKKFLLPSLRRHPGAGKKALVAALLLASSRIIHAQTANGTAGITQANTLVQSYFDVGCTLLYSIGAVVGLVGAVKVYNAWSHGDQQTNKLAASWFGACIFLVVVAAVLKSFFGVQ